MAKFNKFYDRNPFLVKLDEIKDSLEVDLDVVPSIMFLVI
jgi:hypothetical protein